MSKEGRSKYDDATEVALSTESLPPELQAKIAAAREQTRARAAGIEAAPPPAPPIEPAPAERPAWMVDETIALGSGPGAVELPSEILALRRAAQTRTAMAIETPPIVSAPPLQPVPARDETMVITGSEAFAVGPAAPWQAPSPVAAPAPNAPSADVDVLALLRAGPPPGGSPRETASPVLPLPTASAQPYQPPSAPVAAQPYRPAAPEPTYEASNQAAFQYLAASPAPQTPSPAPIVSTPPAIAWSAPVEPMPSPVAPSPAYQPSAPIAHYPVASAPAPAPPGVLSQRQADLRRWGYDEPTTAFMAEGIEVRNKTDGLVAVRPFGMGALVVIKQRFFANRRGELAPVPGAALTESDEFFADAIGRGSLRWPSDLGGPKGGTDVVVLGEALAPHGRAIPQLDVTIRIGPIHRVLRVFGMRTWHKGLFGGLRLTSPQPFESCPLRWELAFGGEGDSINPVGTGREGFTAHTQPPRIEDPFAPIVDVHSRPLPAGLAPIAPQWPLRAAATVGDPRREHVAAPGLTSTGFLRGGEPFELVGLLAEGELRGTLPRTALRVEYRSQSAASEAFAALDTVIVQPTERNLTLVWRLHIPTVDDLHTVRVTEVA